MILSLKKKERLKRAKETQYYPLALNIKNELAVVAGGGKVAITKVKALINAYAKVRIISPDLAPELNKLYKSKKIQWIKRSVKDSDLKEAILVIAATSDSKVNDNVYKWATRRNLLVNIVDQPHVSNFISPSVFRKREATVSVYTNGVSPTLSRDIKNFLNNNWSEFIKFRNSKKK